MVTHVISFLHWLFGRAEIAHLRARIETAHAVYHGQNQVITDYQAVIAGYRERTDTVQGYINWMNRHSDTPISRKLMCIKDLLDSGTGNTSGVPPAARWNCKSFQRYEVARDE